MMKVSEFPKVVCWDPASRSEVMNTMALDVRPDVFSATHYPSMLLENKSQRRVNEEGYVKTFLEESEPHVLDVAVGDSGTGKSHFIRWLYNRIHADNSLSRRFCVRLVPRSSANLADVVLELIREFNGAAIDKVRRELESNRQRTTLNGAANRVLDEFAFILDPENLEGQKIAIPPDVEADLYEVIHTTLPAMLRDQAIRSWLTGRKGGVVRALASHVTGKRGSRDEIDEMSQHLTWRDSDFEIDAAVVGRAGADAKELASTLLNDDLSRQLAARILNDAFTEASKGLLGLKRGDLNRAILEIRRQLKTEDRELVLLIEDMSVAHGLDHDLLEALIVRTRDTGGDEACKLRAVVGVTSDDYNRLPDNIKGRIRQTLSFNIRFSSAAHGDHDEVGQQEIIDFASRYLNAARYGLNDLQSWATAGPGGELESFCVVSGCPNRDKCHRSFGEVSERGLYPFTSTMLMRLYRQRQLAISGNNPRAEAKAFNPRMMVADVLNHVLDEAERSIPSSHFPPRGLLDTFRLQESGAAVKDRLQQHYRSQTIAVDRVITALEIYAQRPSDGKLPPFIAEAFDLPLKIETEHGARDNAMERPVPLPNVVRPSDHQTPKVATTLDEFDRWQGGTGNNLSQSYLNDWRGLVYYAVSGYIDWDQPGMSAVAGYFKRQHINFEGQLPNRQRGAVVVLEVERSPEVALALRGLKTHFQTDDDITRQRMLDLCGQYIRRWSRTVIDQLRSISNQATGLPVHFAAAYLALGAAVRGHLPANASDTDCLAETFAIWPDEDDSRRSTAWRNLRRAFRDYSGKARDFLAESLTCSKGARGGDFIDPTPILDAIRSVRATAYAAPLPQASEAWSAHFDPVRKLADTVQRHLADAVRCELEEIRGWVDAVQLITGRRNFGEICKKVRKAAELAAAVDALGVDGTASLINQCKSLERRAGTLDGCLEAATRALTTQEIGAQLRAIAVMDRQFMDEVLQFLRKGNESLRGALRELSADSGTAATIETCRKAIATHLTSLSQDLVELTAANDGK